MGNSRYKCQNCNFPAALVIVAGKNLIYIWHKDICVYDLIDNSLTQLIGINFKGLCCLPQAYHLICRSIKIFTEIGKNGIIIFIIKESVPAEF